jgi:anti-sigma regulatory factor (Ser/Thr protein kinase)
MVAQPASVPAVRRFVDDALTGWGRPELIDDVQLSATELATNATLHGQGTFFDVELRASSDSVRVAVVDTGTMPAESIALRADLDDPPIDDQDLAFETMTGRGLFIVSSLASSWGIDDLPGGTRIWADFATDGVHSGRQPVLTPTPSRSTRVDGAATQVIHLLDCPPDILLAHDDNLADIARELGLYAASHSDLEAGRIAEQIVEVVRASALSWDAARLVAKQAVHDGKLVVDVAIATDSTLLPPRVAALRQAVLAAEAMADQGLLMTMPAPAPVQAWRDWVEAEMVEQATTGREARPFSDYRAFR